METDNKLGEIVFLLTRQIQHNKIARRGVVRMVTKEQHKEGAQRRMSRMLWDTFTGSAPYKDVFLRGFHLGFMSQLVWDVAASVWPSKESAK